ncbi:MAG: hypothetical protein WD016_01890 [Balneolaceae bacterium]
MKHLNLFLFLLIFGFTAACSSETKEATPEVQKEADSLSSEDFEQSIAALEAQGDRPEIQAQKEQAHLDYGIFLIYNADPANMRENANDALRQFIEVLKINPENEKATSEIEQILGIYRTFPNREPAEDVKEDLQELGFDI